MRMDKLTTKFQQALADAQSMALGLDHGFIEPQHLLLALIDQEDGGTRSLLARANVRVPALSQALHKALENSPKVEGQGGEIGISRELNNLLNLTDKEATKRGDQFVASELFLLALTGDKGETGRLFKEHGGTRRSPTSGSRSQRFASPARYVRRRHATMTVRSSPWQACGHASRRLRSRSVAALSAPDSARKSRPSVHWERQ